MHVVAAVVGFFVPVVLVTAVIKTSGEAPLMFLGGFAVWCAVFFLSKRLDSDRLRTWGYWMVIPTTLCDLMWTVLDVYRNKQSIALFEVIPANDLTTWGAFWVLVPPTFFFFEFHVMWNCCNDDEAAFSRLKHQQQLAGAIWLAVVTIIGSSSIKDWLETQQTSDLDSLTRRVDLIEQRIKSD